MRTEPSGRKATAASKEARATGTPSCSSDGIPASVPDRASPHTARAYNGRPMGRAFFVTTPIYYPNDVPHIGHGYTTVAADFLARYHRLKGDDVLFLTGTDEHGQKLARTAEDAGKTPQEYVDEMEPRWREVWTRLEISFDDYIRTTEDRHTAAVTKLLQAVHDNGRDDIYLG